MAAFNLDLNRIEQHLKTELQRKCTVGFASDFNQVRKTPVQTATLFVLPLDEDFQPLSEVPGERQLNMSELFAVMIVLPVKSSNRTSDELIKTLRGEVWEALVGATLPGWEPIMPHRGRLVELNRETNNLIYQCQFMAERLLDVVPRPL